MTVCATSAVRIAGILADLDLAAWDRDGFLHLPAVFDAAEVAELRSWAEEVSRRAPGELGLMLHYERTAHGPVIARTERLVEAHDGFRSLLVGGLLPAIAGALLGEPSVLSKEKINHKLAGVAGFAPHQDAPAYPFIDTHVSGMVAIDDATTANGCLEVVAGRHRDLLALDERGCITATVVAELDWCPVPTRAATCSGSTPGPRTAAARTGRPPPAEPSSAPTTQRRTATCASSTTTTRPAYSPPKVPTRHG